MSILEVSNLKKIYTTRFGASQVQALSNISFSVEEGEYVAIMGESGSGKTTLLNILAALDQPTDGEVILNGKKLQSVREKEIAAFRRKHLGFVFQDFNLLDNFKPPRQYLSAACPFGYKVCGNGGAAGASCKEAWYQPASG